jgi:hypothetical protein
MRKYASESGNELGKSLMGLLDTVRGPDQPDVREIPKPPPHIRLLAWLFISSKAKDRLPDQFAGGRFADFIGRLAYKSWNMERGELEDHPEYCPHYLNETQGICLGHVMNSNIGCHYCKSTGDYDPGKADRIEGLVEEYKLRHGLYPKIEPYRYRGDF